MSKHLIQSTECFHLIHKNCLKDNAMKSIRNGLSCVKCPKNDCNKQISDFEIRETIGVENYKEIENLILM
jgi:hypothetical protein